MTYKDINSLQSYLQFLVPLRVHRSKWYLGLKAALGGVRDVNWHSEKSFHITAAFIELFLHLNEAYNAQDRVV